MSDIKELTRKILEFRDKRDWKQFHNPKDCAISLVLEATELLEHFQWKNSNELEQYVKENLKEISDELADVLYWVLLISHDLGVDIVRASEEKLAETAKKYPVALARGKNAKYTDLKQ